MNFAQLIWGILFVVFLALSVMLFLLARRQRKKHGEAIDRYLEESEAAQWTVEEAAATGAKSLEAHIQDLEVEIIILKWSARICAIMTVVSSVAIWRF